MAKPIGSFSEGIKDITECCICIETFSNPRMLPCIHTFCHDCLEKTSEEFNWRIREKVPCPLCKQEFILPEDGVSGIPKNFFMENLIQMTNMVNLSHGEELCDPCKENNSPSHAKLYCIECDEKLCRDCANHHKRQKLLKNHQVVEIGSETMILLRKSAGTFCKIHTDKHIEMFCNDCNDATCVVCYAVNHQTHTCFELTNAAKIFKVELKGYVAEIDRCLEDSNNMRDTLIKANANLISDIGRMEKEINQTANGLIDFIQRSKESLILELNSLKMKDLTCIDTQKYKLNSHITMLETFKTYCTEVEAKGSNGDICKSINNLKTRSSELQAIHDSITRQSLSLPTFVLKKSRFGDNLKEDSNCIGTFQDRNSSTNNDSAPFIVRQRRPIVPFGEFSLKKEAEEEVFSRGYKLVTSALIELLNVRHNERQYIGYMDSNTILSIPRDTLNTRAIIEEYVIEKLGAISDMALCTMSDSLYVTDSQNYYIWKIDLNSRNVKCWLRDIRDPCTLSVSRDGRVVVPRDDPQSTKVEVYSPDATLLETIRLPVEIRNVFRAFETTAGIFAILYNWIYDDTPAMCQVNKEGKVTHTYAPEDEQKINRESYILPFYNDRKGSIFVLNNNDTIRPISFILNSQLKYKMPI